MAGATCRGAAIAAGFRGEYLDYDYYNRRVPVIAYGPRLGLGLISFSFGND